LRLDYNAWGASFHISEQGPASERTFSCIEHTWRSRQNAFRQVPLSSALLPERESNNCHALTLVIKEELPYRQPLGEELTMKAVWFGDENNQAPLSQLIDSSALTLASCSLIHCWLPSIIPGDGQTVRSSA
jgi:hypothetical protein